jgi:hypothetical protein
MDEFIWYHSRKLQESEESQTGQIMDEKVGRGYVSCGIHHGTSNITLFIWIFTYHCINNGEYFIFLFIALDLDLDPDDDHRLDQI